MEGGRADFKKPSDYDAKQLRMGAEIEFEHTNDIFLAIEIAMDHLAEEGGFDYYTRLINMEKKMKSDNINNNKKEAEK